MARGQFSERQSAEGFPVGEAGEPVGIIRAIAAGIVQG